MHFPLNYLLSFLSLLSKAILLLFPLFFTLSLYSYHSSEAVHPFIFISILQSCPSPSLHLHSLSYSPSFSVLSLPVLPSTSIPFHTLHPFLSSLYLFSHPPPFPFYLSFRYDNPWEYRHLYCRCWSSSRDDWRGHDPRGGSGHGFHR